MENKKEQVGQYKFENENTEVAPEDFLKDTAPLIGRIVQSFNSLESFLDSALCTLISDRTDKPGLLIIANLSMSQKIQMLESFGILLSEFQAVRSSSIHTICSELKQLNSLRNQVVHADWESAYDDGYTRCRLKITKSDGLHFTYTQFSIGSLNKIIKRMDDCMNLFDQFFG